MMKASTRLVIGVTGHRTLADEGRMVAAVDEVLDRIMNPAAQVVVLSPLAEGADRLVAERVLARPGAELEAVLPIDEAEYEADFADEASKTKFRSFLARARTIHRLPGLSNREEAYAAAGRFVVDHCDIMIAIWNGRPGDGPGGTADIVAYARSCLRRLFVIELPD